MSISGFDLDWLNAVKEKDPSFEGSISQKLGFDPVLCPTCSANLKDGICLNACHLSKEARQRFSELLTRISQRLEDTYDGPVPTD